MGYMKRVAEHAAVRTGTPAERMAAARKAGDLPAFVVAQREQAEAEAEAARSTFEESDEGQLAALASAIRVEAVMLTPEQWAHLHEGQEVPAQPREFFDLNLAERQQVHDRRMAALIEKRTATR